MHRLAPPLLLLIYFILYFNLLISSSITLEAGCFSTVRNMSAFSPYKRVPNSQNPSVSDNPVPDLRTMLQMYTAAVYTLGIHPKSIVPPPKDEEPADKGSKFLMKNILRDEEEKKNAPAVAGSDHASRLEVLVSSLGKSEGGHRCIYCGKVYSRKYGLKIHIR